MQWLEGLKCGMVWWRCSGSRLASGELLFCFPLRNNTFVRLDQGSLFAPLITCSILRRPLPTIDRWSYFFLVMCRWDPNMHLSYMDLLKARLRAGLSREAKKEWFSSLDRQSHGKFIRYPSLLCSCFSYPSGYIIVPEPDQTSFSVIFAFFSRFSFWSWGGGCFFQRAPTPNSCCSNADLVNMLLIGLFATFF